MKKRLMALGLTVSLLVVGCGNSAQEVSEEKTGTSEGAGSVPVVTAEGSIYGTAFTKGYTTLKAEEDGKVVYDESQNVTFTLTFSDGTEVDDSLIDTTNAKVSLLPGDGYLVEEYEWDSSFDGVFEKGEATFHFEEGDLSFAQPEGYTVDNGGKEWSAQGGNGNGEYAFRFSLSGLTYDGMELPETEFPVNIYVYGREFTAQSSPSNPSGSRWGAGGYDGVELPLPEEKPLETEVTVGDEPVWTWIGGDGTYDLPILCDYSHEVSQQGPNQGGNGPQEENGEAQEPEYYDATDNFYVSWPEGVDASNLTDGDVTITLYSAYGDSYVLTPNTGLTTVEENGEEIANGEYSVFSSEGTTQIAVNMVYWAYTPVYSSMNVEVSLDGQVYSQDYEIGSVYTYMVQTGGGLDYEGTVTAQNLYGIANLEELSLLDVAGIAEDNDAYYTYAYKEGEGMQKTAVAWLVENEDGTYSVTDKEEEATQYADDRDGRFVGNAIVSTNHNGEPIEAEWKGETVAFEKSYSVNYGVSNDKEVLQKIQTLPGYVQSYSMMWGDHMRWPWLYFNGQGWLESDGE